MENTISKTEYDLNKNIDIQKKTERDLKLKRLLSTAFKLDAFINNQYDVIQSALDGRDTLVLTRTGGGKSLMFQLPALVDRGVTLVISPLLALIQNQVSALKANNIDAESLNSSTKGKK